MAQTEPPHPTLRGDHTGERVCTTLAWHGGAPPTFALHVARLQRDAAQIALPAPDLHDLARVLAAQCNGPTRMRVEIVADGGEALLERPLRSVLRVTCVPLPPLADQAAPARLLPVAVGLSGASPTAGAKLAALPQHLLARHSAIAAGFDDAALLCADGHVVETAIAALLYGLPNGAIGVAPAQCGHVRSTTVQGFGAVVPLVEVALQLADFATIQWMLMANAIIGARPVGQLGPHALGPPPPALVEQLHQIVGRWPALP